MKTFFNKLGVKKGLAVAFLLTAIVGLGAPPAVAMEQQEKPNWCWAACIQEVLKFHGISATQSEIVANTYGSPVDRPARMEAMALVLRNKYDLHGAYYNYPPTPAGLRSCLLQGKTIIALIDPARNPFEGHFVVLSGGDGNVVGVGDPATGTVRAYPAAVIYNAAWLGSIVVNP